MKIEIVCKNHIKILINKSSTRLADRKKRQTEERGKKLGDQVI